MAIAKNLQNYQRPSGKFKLPASLRKHKKKIIIGAVILSILLGIYGIFNLIRLAPKAEDKQDVVYETGDQPLPQKIMIYIDAEGGLNMREEPNTTSKILKTIPNGTKLEATLVQGDWYQVVYDGKTGWVNKKYVKTYTGSEPVTAETLQPYQNTAFGYSLSFPKDWVKVDYGASQTAGLVSYVGFGAQLADEINPNVLPPLAVKITQDAVATVDASYKAKSSVTAAEATVSGVKGTMYVFTASSGVQMTAYVVVGNGFTYILEESGGYSDELNSLVSSFKII
jgi:hypothetical protein